MSKIVIFIEGRYVSQYLFDGENFADYDQRKNAREIASYECKPKDVKVVNGKYSHYTSVEIERGVNSTPIGLYFYGDEIYQLCGGELINITADKDVHIHY